MDFFLELKKTVTREKYSTRQKIVAHLKPTTYLLNNSHRLVIFCSTRTHPVSNNLRGLYILVIICLHNTNCLIYCHFLSLFKNSKPIIEVGTCLKERHADPPPPSKTGQIFFLSQKKRNVMKRM